MRVRKGALGTAAIAGGAAALSSKGDEKAKATEKPTTKKQGQTAFEKAFRQARREGKKTFTFEGKKYTTDLRALTQARGEFTLEFKNFEELPEKISEKIILENRE